MHMVMSRGDVSRTNIEIDDELVAAARRMHRLNPQRSAIELTFLSLVGRPLSRDAALALQHSGFEYTK
ncbi:type II toxin-antitoxin system VapB family antitoxin [Mycobacterium marinum]|uniref:Antitoxin VapB15 n=1 Tax=Mycobacterium marinum TaxID=1781 RepID=A0A3E2MZA0_MYCMR|nr:type II toxin-antitoxin system VapB family antitoxin [Mycobacterium marinum]RFZ44696.1 Antitoxin VapB15 [Mycobacterium marinum]GJO57084.1 antitoxin VapB [Mycobacterium marinum]